MFSCTKTQDDFPFGSLYKYLPATLKYYLWVPQKLKTAICTFMKVSVTNQQRFGRGSSLSFSQHLCMRDGFEQGDYEPLNDTHSVVSLKSPNPHFNPSRTLEGLGLLNN